MRKLSPFSEQRKQWRKNYLDPSRNPKEWKPFGFHRNWTFERSPEWLIEERDARKEKPEALNFVHAITLSLLSPSGKEYNYKWYMTKKKTFSFQDVAMCLRMFEDYHLLYLEKEALVGTMVDFMFSDEKMELSPFTGNLKTKKGIEKETKKRKKEGRVINPKTQELYIPFQNEKPNTTTE